MESKFKEGDQVECITKGKGTVSEVYNENGMYPIKVTFNNGLSYNYTLDGKTYSSDIRPSLTLGTWEVIEHEPQLTFEDGEIIEAFIANNWFIGYLICKNEDGTYLVSGNKDGFLSRNVEKIRKWKID